MFFTRHRTWLLRVFLAALLVGLQFFTRFRDDLPPRLSGKSILAGQQHAAIQRSSIEQTDRPPEDTFPASQGEKHGIKGGGARSERLVNKHRQAAGSNMSKELERRSAGEENVHGEAKQKMASANSRVAEQESNDSPAVSSMLLPQHGLYRLDPRAEADRYVAEYPKLERVDVQNAIFFADKLKSLFEFRGFEIWRHGRQVGLMPALYMGFPKTGSTTVYEFLEEAMPCVVKDLNKETNFFSYGIRPSCTEKHNLLQSCDDQRIVDKVLEWAGKRMRNAKALIEQGLCSHPVVLDGSMRVLWDRWLQLHERYHHPSGDPWIDGVPFDWPYFIHLLAPHTRFLAIVRTPNNEFVRSHHWYFKKSASMTDYTNNLRSALAEIRRVLDEDEEGRSRCERLQDSKKFHAFPRLNSWASSCNLRPFLHLFGSDSVFITTVKHVLECKDGLAEWMEHALPRGKCLEDHRSLKANVRPNSGSPKTYSAVHKQLEDQILAAVAEATFPPVLVDA